MPMAKGQREGPSFWLLDQPCEEAARAAEAEVGLSWAPRSAAAPVVYVWVECDGSKEVALSLRKNNGLTVLTLCHQLFL
jgi:hypothetical protein